MTDNWFRRICDRGLKFPESYIVLDVETSGLDVKRDYIVQFGHLVVENRVARKPVETVLDWTRCDKASHGDVRQRLAEMEHYFKTRQREAKFSFAGIAREGVDPVEVLRIYHELFKQHQDAGCFFLTHNGIRYDTQIVASHFKRFLGVDFTFDPSCMIDTGLLEKASQLNLLKHPSETLGQFYRHVANEYGKGVYWALDSHCVPKYKLVEKYGLDMRNAHCAGFDCYATHLLMEEFRACADSPGE